LLALNATRTESSSPNSRNAVTTESRVRRVRVRLRNSADHTRCRYFMSASSGRVGLLDQRALVQVQGVAGVLGGLRVVRDHHDGLAVLAVEHLQQREDLLGRLAVQVAGGLVAD